MPIKHLRSKKITDNKCEKSNTLKAIHSRRSEIHCETMSLKDEEDREEYILKPINYIPLKIKLKYQEHIYVLLINGDLNVIKEILLYFKD